MKTKVRLLKNIHLGYSLGTIGIVDSYNGDNQSDWAIVIMPDNRFISIDIEYLEFVEFFNPSIG